MVVRLVMLALVTAPAVATFWLSIVARELPLYAPVPVMVSLMVLPTALTGTS